VGGRPGQPTANTKGRTMRYFYDTDALADARHNKVKFEFLKSRGV
jgi:hypothetical protein